MNSPLYKSSTMTLFFCYVPEISKRNYTRAPVCQFSRLKNRKVQQAHQHKWIENLLILYQRGGTIFSLRGVAETEGRAVQINSEWLTSQ